MGGQPVIVLDTHIWVWWCNQSEQLRRSDREALAAHVAEGLGVSAISCWEVAKLVEKGRLKLSLDLDLWMNTALALPGIVLLPLTPEIAVESVRLPPPIHSDPADQLIVATSRRLGAPLATADERLRNYPGVAKIL
jgi:PIN domain nuclease of toxin-antitoxin system